MNGPDKEQRFSPVQDGPGTSPPWPDEAIEAVGRALCALDNERDVRRALDRRYRGDGLVYEEWRDEFNEQARVALTAAAKASPPIPAPTAGSEARAIVEFLPEELGYGDLAGVIEDQFCTAPTLNQHVTGDESSPVTATGENIAAAVEALGPRLRLLADDLHSASQWSSAVALREALRGAYEDLVTWLDECCQGTGHEQVVPAAKLREFIERSEALPPVDGRTADFIAGKALAFAAIRGWLDEHTTQPTAYEPVQADLREGSR